LNNDEIVKLLIPLVDMTKINISGIHKLMEEMKPKSDDYDEAKILLSMISKERAHDSKIFYEIGVYLVNIDHRLLTDWIEFNECVSKEQCESYWVILKQCDPEKLTIGKLRLLAFQDNPQKFMEYQNSKKIITNNTVELTPDNIESDIKNLICELQIKSFDFNKGKRIAIGFKPNFYGDMSNVCQRIIEFADEHKLSGLGGGDDAYYYRKKGLTINILRNNKN